MNDLEINYQLVIDKVMELGDELPQLSGKVVDIGIKKKWLTDKDVEIEKVLTDLIQTLPGKHEIFAEEMNNDIKSSDSIWIIDPISHTINFLRGLPHYAVVVSHMYKGVMQFACVYDPTMKEMFTAFKGKGTYLNEQKVVVANYEESKTTLYTFRAKSKYSSDFVMGLGKELEQLTLIKNIGSFALHYAWVACGRVDGAISLIKDTFPEFAGKLLVEEAGGKFTDLRGKNLAFDSDAVVTANPEYHAELIKIISKFI